MPATHKPVQARHEEQCAAQTSRYQASSGRSQAAMTSGTMAVRQEKKGENDWPVHVAPPRALRERPGHETTTNAGLRNSDGCTPRIQRRAPLTSCPHTRVASTRATETTKTITRGAPHMARRQERCRDQHDNRRREIQRLPVHEMKRRQVQPLCNGRGAGHREHKAAHHQKRQRAQEPAVYRPQASPKTTERSAREIMRRLLSAASETVRRTRSRKQSPRIFVVRELIVGRAGRR